MDFHFPLDTPVYLAKILPRVIQAFVVVVVVGFNHFPIKHCRVKEKMAVMNVKMQTKGENQEPTRIIVTEVKAELFIPKSVMLFFFFTRNMSLKRRM